MAKVYTTDVGTLIKLDTGEDISSGVSEVKIIAKPPDESAAVELAATVVETTKVQHTKTADTLDETGEWELQAKVTYIPGDIYRGEKVVLMVYAPLS
jgi:formyltetrahydrofolate synthetase